MTPERWWAILCRSAVSPRITADRGGPEPMESPAMPAPEPDRPEAPQPEFLPSADLAPAYCTVGPQFCRLSVWTEPQYAQRVARERPARATHVPGLGWVVALPVASLN